MTRPPDSPHPGASRSGPSFDIPRPGGAEAVGALPSLEAGRVLGDFRLVAELGRGGMGVVWEADQLSLGRHVALKILSPDLGLTPRHLERFQREAEAGGRLTHAGIVQTLAVGEEGGLHWIAQELVPGGFTRADSIAELHRRAAPPAGYYRAAAELMAQVADALHYAHQAGVVHRDVKPGNILIGSDDRPKVADFGLALVEGGLGLSRTGDFLGTPFYVSPEQAMSRRMGLDHRSDVFSFGATLYEVLTLTRAFDGDTSQQVFQRILTEDPPDPRRLRSRVPRDLAVICLKCLEKNPDHRYQDMAAATADLRRYLADEPVLARPAGPLRRARKWLRRHPVLGTAGALTTAALLVISLLLVQVDQARREALAAAGQARIEASTATRVQDFLTSLFAENDPARLQGREVTVREVLDRGAEQIREQLLDEPDVRARLFGVLGNVYSSLGLLEPAEELLHQAILLRRGAAGDGPETLEAENDLAVVYQQQGRYDDAEPLLRETWEGRRRVLGEDHPATLSALNNLASIAWSTGRQGEAEDIYTRVLEARRAGLGEDHPLTLRAMHNLGTVYRAQGRYPEAETLFREVVERQDRVLGPRHPDSLKSRQNLARLLARAGRWEEAEAMARETAATQEEVLGREHPETLTTLADLAGILQRQGRLDGAEPLLLDVLERQRRSLGPRHPAVFATMNQLAGVYWAKRELERAEPLARESLELKAEVFGDDHPETLSARSNLALLLQVQGKLDQAEPMFQAVLDKRREILGRDHPDTLTSAFNLALLRASRGAVDEAVAELREVLEAQERVLGEAHPHTQDTRRELEKLLAGDEGG